MQKHFIFKNSYSNVKKFEFLAPKFVYLPITKKVNKPLKLNDKILKGEYLNDIDYSSVSGTIVGSKICNNFGRKTNCLVIANNYKEQRIKKFKESKKDRLLRLLDPNIKERLATNHQNLILTCFNDRPNTFNNELLIADCYQDILDILYLLKDIYKFNNIYILVKDIETKSIEKFTKIVGSYPELRFITIPNIYPINNTNYFKEALNIDDYTVVTFKEIYKMFHIINYSFGNVEEYITINIDDKNPIVVKTKIGTNIKELFDNIKVKYEGYNIYLNGPIGGICVTNLDNAIVTEKLDLISLTKKTLPLAEKCLNCGNCLRYCPQKIDPRLAITNKEYRLSIKDQCLKCGLCNYICPSYIRLKEKIEGDDNNEITQ